MSAATGRTNKLTGQVGEYLVAAELARRGLMATTFAGNVPHYDIVATDGRGRHVSVQVKTTRSPTWQFAINSFCMVSFEGRRQVVGRAHPEPAKGLVVVLVRLEPARKDRFFILTWTKLRDVLVGDYCSWLDGLNGIRRKNPESLHTALRWERVLKYEDKWDTVLDGVR